MTLDFYSNIYEPLFRKNYTKGSDRSFPALHRFEKYSLQHGIQVHRIVDVGCAWGKALKYWTKRKCKVVGVDVSKTAVKYCKKNGYNCKLASATDLSIFPNNHFDLYMSTDVYEHLRPEDLPNAISEAKRVTSQYLLIRAHPAKGKRKGLHLCVQNLDLWKSFFESSGLMIINNFGDNYNGSYKNTFLLKKK